MSSRPASNVKHIAHWDAVAKVHGARFAGIRPANVMVQANLVGDEYLVEIEAEAVIGSSHGSVTQEGTGPP